MPLNIGKVIKFAFITFTAVLIIVLSYTVIVYLGVADAVRKIDVSVQDLDVTFLDSNASVMTTLSIRNPSRFAFEAKSLFQKLYLNGKFVEGKWLRDIIIPPFSNTPVTMAFNDVPLPGNTTEPAQNWLVSMFINLETPLPENVSLHFDDLNED